MLVPCPSEGSRLVFVLSTLRIRSDTDTVLGVVAVAVAGVILAAPGGLIPGWLGVGALDVHVEMPFGASEFTGVPAAADGI